MKSNPKAIQPLLLGVMAILFSWSVDAQSSNNQQENCKENNSKSEASTSGCAPSSCRGAQTKFGEAKVISNLRSLLVSLKAKMETSTSPKFEARSYDIHNIVGESDEESLKIIIRELKVMETEVAHKTDFEPLKFALPENKAKQISYLENRLKTIEVFLQ
ncbi:MAG: hypothetical protein AAFX55_05005 [Bacteroidota bacterium]